MTTRIAGLTNRRVLCSRVGSVVQSPRVSICIQPSFGSSKTLRQSPYNNKRLGESCITRAASATPNNDDRPMREILSPDGIIEPDGTVSLRPPLMADEEKRLWKAAIKAPMYSVGIVPILISGIAAYMYTGAFNPLRTLGLIVSSIAIIGWLNLSNDVFDSLTGVDRTKKESVVNLTGNRGAVFLVANALLLAGGALLFHLVGSVPNPFPAKALYAAIACGYVYQGPPFRWSYLGLGEPLCFIAFGPLATLAFYMAQIPPAMAAVAPGASIFAPLNSSIIALSILVGITTTVILYCSHFHQIQGDRKAGKKSPLVRQGTVKGAQNLKFAVGFCYAVTLVLSLLGYFPFACWTSAMVAYGYANEMVKLAENNPDDPEALRPLKMMATRWHIGFHAMMILGFIVQKLMVI